MKNLTGKPQLMKQVNSSLIKKVIKENGSATRADIAARTNISLTTIRSLITELINNEEIISIGCDESSGGRKAERYVFNLNKYFSLSFCIGNKEIHYAVTDIKEKIIESGSFAVHKDILSSVDNFMDVIIKKKNIKAVGIGVPGIVDNGNYLTASQDKSWKKLNIGEHIQKKYNIPVILENDLNSIALGFSLNYIKEKNISNTESLNIVYIHFTESCTGAGIISNGNLVHGKNNFAGELGFIPIDREKSLDHILINNPDEDVYTNTIAKIISILYYVINPEFIVLGGTHFKSELFNQIINKSKTYISSGLPEIIHIKDSQNDYFKGISHLSTELIFSDIKLVNK